MAGGNCKCDKQGACVYTMAVWRPWSVVAIVPTAFGPQHTNGRNTNSIGFSSEQYELYKPFVFCNTRSVHSALSPVGLNSLWVWNTKIKCSTVQPRITYRPPGAVIHHHCVILSFPFCRCCLFASVANIVARALAADVCTEFIFSHFFFFAEFSRRRHYRASLSLSLHTIWFRERCSPLSAHQNSIDGRIARLPKTEFEFENCFWWNFLFGVRARDEQMKRLFKFTNHLQAIRRNARAITFMFADVRRLVSARQMAFEFLD